MKNDTRYSGIEIVGNIPCGTHFSQFYQTKDDLIEILIPYFKAGLENNEFCLWITSDIIDIKEAKELLKEFILNIDTFFEKGQIEIISFNNFYSKKGIFDYQKILNDLINRSNKALTSGYNGIRLIENICPSKKKKLDNFIDYERRLNSITGYLPIIAICTFSLELCSPNDIIKIATNHDFTLVKNGNKWEQIKNSAQENNIKHKWNESLRNAINSINQIIHSTLNFDEIMKRTVSEAAKIIGSETAAISLRKGNLWKVCYVYGFPDSVIGAEMNDEEEPHAILAIKTKRPVAINDAFNDERVNRNHMKRWGIRSVLVVPLMTKDEVIGVIFFNFQKSTFIFENTHIDFAVQLAASVSLALENSRLFENLEIELAEHKKVEEALQEAHKELQIRSEKLQASYEELQIQSEKLEVQTEELEETYQALGESEKHYRMLFTNMSEGFAFAEIICDKDGKPIDYRYLDINPAYEVQTGIKKEQALGKSALEVFGKVTPVTIEIFEEVALSGKSAHFETFSQAMDKYFEAFVFSPEYGEFAIIFTDITERKQAEDKLRYHANLVDSISDAVISTDKELNIKSWNKAAERIYGWQADEVIGLNGSEILQTTFPEKLTREIIARDIFEKGHWEGELIQKTKDGRDITVYAKSMVLKDEAGVAVGGVSIISDITEHKKKEEALLYQATLLNKAGIPVISTDEKSIIRSWNKAAEKLYGWTADEVIGKANSAIWPLPIYPDGHDRKETTRQIVEKGIWSGEITFSRKDGTSVIVIASTVVLKDSLNHITGFLATHVDITSHKRAEEALRESEKKYHMLFDSIDEGFCTIEVLFDENDQPFDYRFLDLNRAFERQTGIHYGAGRTVREFAPAHEQYWFDIYGNVARTGEPARFQREAAHLSRYFYYDVYAFRIGAPGDNTVGVLFSDITDRKRAEEALLGSEQLFSKIFHSNPTAIAITCAPDYRYVDVNETWLKLFGYRRDEVIGRTSKELNMFPSNYAERETIVKKTIEKGSTRGQEIIACTKTGEPLNVLSSTEVVDIGGKVHILSTTVDLTEQKQGEEALKEAYDTLEEKVKERTSELEKAYNLLRESEEKYRNIIETANEGIAIIDSNFKTTYVNKKMAEMLGYSQEEIIDKIELSFTYEDGKAIVNPKRRSLLQNISKTFEFKFIRKDGSPLWTLISSKSIFDEDGNFTGVLNMFTDITERKEAEFVLEKIRIARQKEIHHRIKNNLQVISSLLDLQADKFNSKEHVDCSEVLNAFRESQDRIMSIALIHKELHDGKETDKLNFSIYLQRLADNLFQTYRLETAKVILNLDIEESIFLDVDIAVPLGMIVNEVISNSLKYAFAGRNTGEIQIKLHGRKGTQEGNKGYVLNISDNGIGIPENIDFENQDTLGMQLVNILVKQIDGCIELKRNQGTEFTILFINVVR